MGGVLAKNKKRKNKLEIPFWHNTPWFPSHSRSLTLKICSLTPFTSRTELQVFCEFISIFSDQKAFCCKKVQNCPLWVLCDLSCPVLQDLIWRKLVPNFAALYTAWRDLCVLVVMCSPGLRSIVAENVCRAWPRCLTICTHCHHILSALQGVKPITFFVIAHCYLRSYGCLAFLTEQSAFTVTVMNSQSCGFTSVVG